MSRRMWKAGLPAPAALLSVSVLLLSLLFTPGCSLFRTNDAQTEPEESYTRIKGAELPLVRMSTGGHMINELEACAEGNRPLGSCKTVTPVPGDGTVRAVICGGEELTASVSYDIMDETGTVVIASGQATDLKRSQGQVSAVIKIGNRISEGKEYLLKISLETNNGRKADYFTRIRSGELHFDELYEFAEGFHNAAFDKEALQEYVKYLETDPNADRSTLARVDIKSGTGQITWGSLDVEPKGDARYSVIQADGSFASFLIDYEVTAAAENDIERTFQAQDFICLQYTSDRFYVMAYDREVMEVFDPEGSIGSKGITLGISPAERVSAVTSPDESWVAFCSCGELWEYSKDKGQIRRIFSYKNSQGQFTDDYGISVRSVSDSGDIDFFVFGRMGAGIHEGRFGLSSRSYIEEKEAISELFFVESGVPVDIAAMDMGDLSGSSENRSWFLYGDTVWSVDAEGVMSELIENVSAKSPVINASGTAMAWGEGDDPDCPNLIRLWCLEEDEPVEIAADAGSYLIPEGFVGDELIYTIGRKDDIAVMDGAVLKPRSVLVAVAKDGQEVSRHQAAGKMISEVKVDGVNVHLELVSRNDGSYTSAGSDVLVRSGMSLTKEGSSINERTLERRQRVLQLTMDIADAADVKNAKTVTKLLERESVADISDRKDIIGYIAYVHGRPEGIYDVPGQAIVAANPGMGYVTDGSGAGIWHRTGRTQASIELSKEEAAQIAGAFLADGVEQYVKDNPEWRAYDLNGCTVRQALYFLDQKKPVFVINSDGSCAFIVGYDLWNVYIQDPFGEGSGKMGIKDAEKHFEGSRLWTYWTENKES